MFWRCKYTLELHEWFNRIEVKACEEWEKYELSNPELEDNYQALDFTTTRTLSTIICVN